MATLFTTPAFAVVEPKEVVPGVYGSCGCKSSGLELKDDFTFRYFDPAMPEDVSATWTADPNFVWLVNVEGGLKIANKWKRDKKHNCLEARQGLTFIRFCHLDYCQQ